MEAARESMAALLDAGLFDSAQTLVRDPRPPPFALQISRVLRHPDQLLRSTAVLLGCGERAGWVDYFSLDAPPVSRFCSWIMLLHDLQGCFLVSSAGASNEAGMSMKVEGLVLHGDALHGEKEFRRALSAYKQAMQYSKSIPRQATSNTRSSVSTTSRNIWFCLGILYDIIPPGVEFGHIIHDFDMDGEEENPSPASEDPPYSL